MKFAAKTVSFICVICMALAAGIVVHAADAAPQISVVMDKTGKNAELKLDNIETMIYSAQITVKVSDINAEYTLTPASKNMYATVTKDTEQKTLTMYVDSTELLDGQKEIKLADVKSTKEISVGNKAELIVVDRSMRDRQYSDVKVNVKSYEEETKTPNKPVSSSNNSGSGSIYRGTGTASNINTSAGGFIDVSSDFWAAESIKYVSDRGLFEGTSDTTFEPYAQMTRAMYVTVLSRFGTKLDEKWRIDCDTPKQFGDVEDGAWYADAVGWAGGAGLVQGMGDDEFGPNYPITREQMAVIIVNFAKLCGAELPANVEAAEFADASEIHDWAVDAVRTAQSAGLIQGRDDGIFAPADTATRAEVATIMHRFVQTLN